MQAGRRLPVDRDIRIGEQMGQPFVSNESAIRDLILTPQGHPAIQLMILPATGGQTRDQA